MSETLIAELIVHPLNEKLYGKGAGVTDDLIASIKDMGVIEPIAVDDKGFILSGTRRWLAAKTVGLSRVPTRTVRFKNETLKQQFLIEANRQRKKTPEVLAREWEALAAIEAELAKKRMIVGKKTDPRGTCPQGAGKAEEIAAAKLGTSRRTQTKLRPIVAAADSGDDRARELLDKVNANELSINSASHEWTFPTWSPERMASYMKEREARIAEDEQGKASLSKRAEELVQAGRRALAIKYHSDKGGSDNEMAEVNAVAKWLLALIAENSFDISLIYR